MTDPVFAHKSIHSWEQFLDALKDKKANWIFRGQASDKPLRTTLERALNDYQIDLAEAPGIEEKLIRDFRRRYFGPDYERVLNDTLYCLSLMRHHSAPIRLLDFNYSAYIAAFFAFNDRIPNQEEQDAGEFPVIWCFNTDWLRAALKKLSAIGTLIPGRDAARDDYSFQQLYMGPNPQPFVFAENPVFLNERLIIQQGLFLCPGDVSQSFEDNIKSLGGWTNPDHILKFNFNLNQRSSHRDNKRIIIHEHQLCQFISRAGRLCQVVQAKNTYPQRSSGRRTCVKSCPPCRLKPYTRLALAAANNILNEKILVYKLRISILKCCATNYMTIIFAIN